MTSLAPDPERIQVKGRGLPFDRHTERVWVSPWDTIGYYKVSDASGPLGVRNQILRIAKAPRRYRVCIGALYACTHSNGDGFTPLPANMEISLVDERYSKLVGAPPLQFLEVNSGSYLCRWQGSGDSVVGGVEIIGKVELTLFPDGLLLPRDCRPAFNFTSTGNEAASATVWYRYEEWT